MPKRKTKNPAHERPLAREMAKNVAQQKSRKRKRTKTGYGYTSTTKFAKDDTHGMYIRDIQKTDLLADKATEVSIAEKLEKHEVAAWMLVLASPKAAGGLPQAFEALNKEGRNEIKYPTKTFKTQEDKCRELRKVDYARRALRKSIDVLAGPARNEAESNYRASTALRDILITANLRLVVSMANRFRNMGSDIEDIIQEGNLGLMKAAALYDYRRNVRFSTFASWWIRHGIGRSLSDHSRTVRVPVHVLDATAKVKKYDAILKKKLGRDPTIKELVKATKLTEARVESAMTTVVSQSFSLDMDLSQEDGESRTFYDITPDESVEHTADSLSRLQLDKMSADMVAMLTPFEKDVIAQRYGMDGTDEEKTLREIGDKNALSRERIRQIQNVAIVKMRAGAKRLRIPMPATAA